MVAAVEIVVLASSSWFASAVGPEGVTLSGSVEGTSPLEGRMAPPFKSPAAGAGGVALSPAVGVTARISSVAPSTTSTSTDEDDSPTAALPSPTPRSSTPLRRACSRAPSGLSARWLAMGEPGGGGDESSTRFFFLVRDMTPAESVSWVFRKVRRCGKRGKEEEVGEKGDSK